MVLSESRQGATLVGGEGAARRAWGAGPRGAGRRSPPSSSTSRGQRGPEGAGDVLWAGTGNARGGPCVPLEGISPPGGSSYYQEGSLLSRGLLCAFV